MEKIDRLFLTGELLSILLGTVLPEPVAAEVQSDPKAQTLARQVQGRLFESELPTRSLGEAGFQLQARERMRDRARFFFRGMLALELGDLEFFPGSKSLIALYRATWPIRVTGMYGLAAVQQLGRVVGRRRLARGGG